MQIYHFTEQPYPNAWDQPYLRVDLPNGHCDPHVASHLYNRYIDEWMLADEVGMNVMVNEHHSTSTCLAASSNVFLSILARQTRRARILVLGVPLTNRADPIRVAEELSIVDVISGGRLEMGFVKGVPYEVHIANLNPVGMMDRFWEAHDLILKAMTTRDGPFSWEGKHFQYRGVNIWPRPMQQPHPPVWITSLSPSSAPGIARFGYVLATVLIGYGAKAVFDSYRNACAEMGRPAPGNDRFAYTALSAIADNEVEARRRGAMVREYLIQNRVRLPYAMPPGYFPPAMLAKSLRETSKVGKIPLQSSFGKALDMKDAGIDELVDAGCMFCGTPDQVFRQIEKFHKGIGGFGHLILMAQAGKLNHRDTADSIRLFGAEVMPKLKDRFSSKAVAA
jgi:alkanesulfonate monooxygenase SsuD/methylene tetrahydromethanopterin reductase-like flavin-dependent oxidoreductase (luciferase family)